MQMCVPTFRKISTVGHTPQRSAGRKIPAPSRATFAATATLHRCSHLPSSYLRPVKPPTLPARTQTLLCFLVAAAVSVAYFGDLMLRPNERVPTFGGDGLRGAQRQNQGHGQRGHKRGKSNHLGSSCEDVGPLGVRRVLWQRIRADRPHGNAPLPGGRAKGTHVSGSRGLP